MVAGIADAFRTPRMIDYPRGISYRVENTDGQIFCIPFYPCGGWGEGGTGCSDDTVVERNPFSRATENREPPSA